MIDRGLWKFTRGWSRWTSVAVVSVGMLASMAAAIRGSGLTRALLLAVGVLLILTGANSVLENDAWIKDTEEDDDV